ncbi:MAG TPA: 6,7-dimethyl-8-ribityllumazine synthase [Miltoncostaeaceae bacterium]|nr:6,7-dimethyl-8-ribityllumazine synthase [Miltoncostaeaceae bacterium]
MSRSGPPAPATALVDPTVRIAAVVAGFHREISERLLEGAGARLREAGLPEGNLDVRWVPGAFELPLAAQEMARRGQYAAIVALGLVVRGETAHFDYICNSASLGLSRVGLDTGVPCAFGVLTTENHAQAEARSGGTVGNAGADAADAAIAMINLLAESN